jgi:hypothetical protein
VTAWLSPQQKREERKRDKEMWKKQRTPCEIVWDYVEKDERKFILHLNVKRKSNDN